MCTSWRPTYICDHISLSSSQNEESFGQKLFTKSRHTLWSVTFFENRAVHEIKLKNNVQPYRPQMGTWRMRIAFWISKATNTHAEYVIPFALPLQQWLHKRASPLRYTHTACLVCLVMFLYEYHCYSMANTASWEYKWTKTCWTRAIRVIRVKVQTFRKFVQYTARGGYAFPFLRKRIYIYIYIYIYIHTHTHTHTHNN